MFISKKTLIEKGTINECNTYKCIFGIRETVHWEIKNQEKKYNYSLSDKDYRDIEFKCCYEIKNGFACLSDLSPWDDYGEGLFINEGLYIRNLHNNLKDFAKGLSKPELFTLEKETHEDGIPKIRDRCEDVFLKMCEEQLPSLITTKYILRSEAYRIFLDDYQKEAIGYLRELI